MTSFYFLFFNYIANFFKSSDRNNSRLYLLNPDSLENNINDFTKAYAREFLPPVISNYRIPRAMFNNRLF